MRIEPGVYTDLSNDDYHNSEGMSKTKLDMFARDPASLEWAKNCPVDEAKLKTLDFGDAAHAICLEPERLKSDFIVMPKFGMKAADKEAKAEWIGAHSHLKIVTADERKKLGLMFESVMAHPTARKFLEADGIAEQSHYWIDDDTGELCKCRPDRALHNSPILMDIKTTDSIEKFKFSIEDYRYYIQDPFYLDGYNASTGEEKEVFVFLLIQKTIELGRYPVACVTLPDMAKEYGRRQYKQELADYARAKEVGRFPGVHEAVLSYNFNKKIEL